MRQALDAVEQQLGALAHGGAGHAEEDREHDDLQDLVVHQRANRRIREDVLDEAVECHRVRIDARAHAADDFVDAQARLEQVYQKQAERQ